MSLSDEEIVNIAEALYGGKLSADVLKNHKTITFARLIAAKQKEIDAALCKAEKVEVVSDEGYAYNVAIKHCAAAIRSQGD